ncbi:hypothetical protein C2E23DRAFT_805636 [Lenzites betulinus]|nr:hypothetical protein C2E23DRAFT_805636 [Lenzites betulinus]
MAARPKNNLDELKRARSAIPPLSTPAPSTPRSAAGKSKFKPTVTIPSSTPSTVTVRKLPPFSTPNLSKPKTPLFAPVSTSTGDNSFSSIISISSTDTTPLRPSTSSVPAKRLSASFPDDLVPESPPKRPKTTHSVDKENRFHSDPSGKGKGRAHEVTPSAAPSTTSASGLTVVHKSGPTNSIRSKAGAAELRSSFEALAHDADLEEKSEEELRGVITTAQDLIEGCDRQVGAARADAGEPRDVALCNLFNDYLERRLASARALLKAIQRGERPATGRAPSVTRQVNSASQHVLAPIVPTARLHVEQAGTETEDEYWGDDVPLDVIEEPQPSAPATPPATQPRALATVTARPVPAALPSVANPLVADPPDRLTKKPYYKHVIDTLRKVFGLQNFRPLQLEAICDVMEGRDVFVLFPTGSGKSLTYQLPAVCLDGLTVVVSPLTSLIHDQYRALTERGVDVEKLLGEMPESKKREVQQRLFNGDLPKLLYLTPEMLQMSGMMESTLTKLRNQNKLRCFVIDEAHLITDWGRSFRDSYKHLSRLRDNYPGVPIMALTATASKEIQQDIVRELGITVRAPYKLPFNRPNLDYEVRVKKKDFEKEIAAYIKEHHPGESGIIYCGSRNGCEELAKRLRETHGINAKHFHASMDARDKCRVQEMWNVGEFQVIVATVAFGMGIDKPDVRFVIHHSPPTAINRYYQETGRAGRDGNLSHCILYFNQGDFARSMDRIQKDDITEIQRREQQEELRVVMRYCSNDVRCRRQQVITFFGDEFDPADCHQLCDNCRNSTPYVTEDHSTDAQNTIRLLENISRRDVRVTAVQLASALKGSRAKDLVEKGITDVESYGACSHLTKNIIDRLIDEMFHAGILKSEIVVNQFSGYSQAYLALDKSRADRLRTEKFEITFRVAAGSKAPGRPRTKPSSKAAPAAAGYDSPSAGPSKAPASRARNPPRQFAPLPMEPEISLYRDEEPDPAWIDDEIEDIEDVDSPPPPARRMPTRAAPAAAQSMTEGYDSDIEEINAPPYRVTLIEQKDVSGASRATAVEDLETQCYEELVALRDELIREDEDGNRLEDLLKDETLQLLALMPPNDMQSLRTVLEMENIDVDDLKQHKKSVLNVCIQYHMLRRGK